MWVDLYAYSGKISNICWRSCFKISVRIICNQLLTCRLCTGKKEFRHRQTYWNIWRKCEQMGNKCKISGNDLLETWKPSFTGWCLFAVISLVSCFQSSKFFCDPFVLFNLVWPRWFCNFATFHLKYTYELTYKKMTYMN